MKKENKLVYILKYFLFIIKLIFYVAIGILSFGFAFLLFAGSDTEEKYFNSDFDLMKEWQDGENKKL